MSTIKVFLQGKRVERTYSINQIVWWLRTLPVVGKNIPYTLYSNTGFKVLVYIIHLFKAIVTFCLSHFIYLGMLLLISYGLVEDKIIGDAVTFEQLAVHIIVLLSVIGMIVNSKLFDPTQDKYYSIVLMRLDAKKYAMGLMIYEQIRYVLSYLLVGIFCTIQLKISFTLWLLVTAGGCIGKYIGCAIELWLTKHKVEYARITINCCISLVMLAITIAMLLMGHTIPLSVAIAIDIVAIIVGLICMIIIITEKEFKRLYVYHLSTDSVFYLSERVKENEIEKTQNIIRYDEDLGTSDKEGYKYFHELFVKRHKKILWGRSKILTIALLTGAVLLPVSTLVISLFGQVPEIDNMMKVISVLPIFMYLINTGEVCANAMFINCDGAMLTYNYYRTPEVVRGIFIERLKTIVKLNLMPATILSIILCEANFFFGLKQDYRVYCVFVIMTLSLSIFFSVHRLVIYYLLQPYTEEMEKKSAPYSIINFMTYFVSYQLPNVIPENVSNIEWFVAGAVIVFTIVYVIVAINLAYRLAPRTFKIAK